MDTQRRRGGRTGGQQSTARQTVDIGVQALVIGILSTLLLWPGPALGAIATWALVATIAICAVRVIVDARTMLTAARP